MEKVTLSSFLSLYFSTQRTDAIGKRMRQNDFDEPTEYARPLNEPAEQHESPESPTTPVFTVGSQVSKRSSRSQGVPPPLPSEPTGMLEIVTKFVPGIGQYHKDIKSHHSKDFRDGKQQSLCICYPSVIILRLTLRGWCSLS
jgi:hypothetical protein